MLGMVQSDVSLVLGAYLGRYRGATRRGYGYHLERWLSWCASQGVAPLGARLSDVERYVHYLSVETGHRPHSVSGSLTPVRGFYRIALNDGFVDRDPAAKARLPRVVAGPGMLGLDRHDMQALLKLGRQRGGRHQAAIYLLGCLGLGNTEARSVQVENFSQTVRGHRVLQFVGSRGIPARMPLPVSVARALDASAQGRDSGPLMLRPDGRGPLSAKSLRTLVRNLGVAAGISVRVYPNLLRVSCIVSALDSGASPRKVQDLARVQVGTTLRYERDRTSHDEHAVHALLAYLTSPEDGSVATLDDHISADGDAL